MPDVISMAKIYTMHDKYLKKPSPEVSKVEKNKRPEYLCDLIKSIYSIP